MSAKVALSVITAGALAAVLLGSTQSGPVHDHFGRFPTTPVVEPTLPADSATLETTMAPRP